METVSRAATKAAQLLNVRVRQDVLDDGMTALMPKDIAPLSASHKSTVFFPQHLKFMPIFIVGKAARLLFMCPCMLLQQVGIMFDGKGFVQFMLPGGPAHASRKIVKGDQIIKVDGMKVSGNGLLQAITGSDMPGSFVTFTIQKESV